MTTFGEAQEQRDHMARHDCSVGDECRRWTRCTRCGWTSPQLRFWHEQDEAEDWHYSECTAIEQAIPVDEDLGIWTYPDWNTFRHRLEPAVDESPVRRAFDPVPYAPRRRAILTSPQEAA